MARRKLKLTIDLVPESCWYKSLHRQMPRTRWDELRERMFAKARNRCEICGDDGKLHCHELWAYDTTKPVQKLRGFKAVCQMCHHVIHFGQTQILADKGYLDLDVVVQHFVRVNKVTPEVFGDHEEEAFAFWRQRSCLKWRTDLGKYAAYVSKKAVA